ncbi:hypothetical protein F0562_025484 [Nyssa sinensis]|uniref:Uncharacterized protein n=1 Tax=Nyssa sinensis TaxID=561372 RepID=A0A5J5BA17_9ASTE|nr:hypothetical protein F0562_025484 [Nyssa sinensis]
MSMAITSCVYKLELEMRRLRQKMYKRDRVILDPRSAVGSPQEISDTISPMETQYKGQIACLHDEVDDIATTGFGAPIGADRKVQRILMEFLNGWIGKDRACPGVTKPEVRSVFDGRTKWVKPKECRRCHYSTMEKNKDGNLMWPYHFWACCATFLSAYVDAARASYFLV